MKMNKYKASGMLFIFAGVLFTLAALVGKKLWMIPLGVLFIILGINAARYGK